MYDSHTSLERYDTPSDHPLGSLSSILQSTKRSDLGSVGSNPWQHLFVPAVAINTTIKDARVRMVIGIKKAICTGFATQPATSALNIPFTVRLQDAGGSASGIVEYEKRRYVSCRMTMSNDSEEILVVQTWSTRIPCIIAWNNGRYRSFFSYSPNPIAWLPRPSTEPAIMLTDIV